MDLNPRVLSGTIYVRVWADGVQVNLLGGPRNQRQCILVSKGVTEDGNKELTLMRDGYD